MRRAHEGSLALITLFLLALVVSCDNGTGPIPCCDPDTASADPTPDYEPVLAVAELGAQLQNITLTREGVPVTDHRVLVNWVTIPHVGAGRYVGQLPSTVPAGSPINLVLGGDGLIIYAAGGGTVPEAPVLTAPVTGATFGAVDSVTVTWTSATDPERFVVSGSFVVDGVTVDSTVPAAGDQRELRIAARELPAGVDLQLSVVACNEGSLGGSVDPDSRMDICAPSEPIAITISTATATVAISTTTTGAAFDADDYVVLVDGVEIGRRLGLNDNITVSGEPGQTMQLELADVADNCEVDGPPRRTVTLVDDSVTNTSFAVRCVAPAGLESVGLVFATGSCDRSGMMAYHGACDLYAQPLDGSEGRFLTTEGHSFQPAISADGSTITFARQSSDWRTDVYAMDVDGTNPRPITDDGRSWDPSWSPDGTGIVRVYGLAYPGWPGELQIRRFADEDASSLSLPTPAVAEAPAWSPDGNHIAFTGWNGRGNIFTIAPDGHDAALLVEGGTGPVWSPASDRLAYEMAGSVYVIELNGEEGTKLLSGDPGWIPTDWSPSGEWIALTRRWRTYHAFYVNDLYDVYLLRVDDGTMVRVTRDHRSSSAVFVPGS